MQTTQNILEKGIRYIANIYYLKRMSKFLLGRNYPWNKSKRLKIGIRYINAKAFVSN